MTKPIHIGLFLQGGRHWLGGFEYIRSVLVALGAVARPSGAVRKITLLTQERLEEPWHGEIGGLVDHTVCLADEGMALTFARRLRRKLERKLLRRETSLLPGVIGREKIDFVYPYTPDARGNRDFAYASWIADFQHKHLPANFSRHEILDRDAWFEGMARRSPCVVLSSRDAEQDFQHYYPFASQKSRVFPFRTPCQDGWYAHDPAMFARDYSLPDKFFLVANQFWKHKNHLLVFRAIKKIVERGWNPTVVFTGNLSDSRFPEYTDAVLQTIQQLGIHSQVRLLGVVPKGHYVQLMRRCIAVVQPSLFEGWSTIVEDGRSLGKEIILSDLAIHREQDPPKSVFFMRSSEESLADCMIEKWNLGQPGPDQQAENEARQKNVSDVQAQGTRFLEIAIEACRRLS